MSPKNKTIKKTKLKLKLKPKSEKVSRPRLVLKKKPEYLVEQTMKQTSIVEDKKVYNEEFTKLLEKLYQMMISKGEAFRGRAYKKAQETIINLKEPITSVSQLKGKPGIGETILSKLQEYVETGTLKLIEREKENPIYVFTQVYGIGPSKAKELVTKHNIKTIEELRNHTDLLNDKQKIGLKYYEAILERIPRSEIEQYDEKFQKIFAECGTDTSSYSIVGSYRRGAEDSGDIDVIIGNSTGDSSVFNACLDKMIEKNLIIEVLSRGAVKSLVIAQLPGKTPRRVDFLFSPPEEYAFATLYFTGSATFNTVMRQHALQRGYTMNEHGIYKMENKKKGSRIDLLFNNEQDIFTFLGLQYKTPIERIDGSAVHEITKADLKKGTEKKALKQRKTKVKLTLKKPKKETITNDKTHIDAFIKTGIDYLYGLNEKMLVSMLQTANDAYYNESSLMSDGEYDILKEYLEEKYPKNVEVKNVGAPIVKEKVKLPYYMGSMDKIKPDTGAIQRWIAKYNGQYVLSAKLDGISGLYSTEGGVAKLYTRGNGIEGQDISYMIPYLHLPKDENITIRGELIMTKKMFEDKYASSAANARNLVSGFSNRKTVEPEDIRSIDFVAYEVIHPSLKPSEQFALLNSLDVKTVIHDVVQSVSNESLSELLINWRESYDYEIDGIICTNDAIYPRKKENPKYAFAFKMVLSDQVVEAKVVDVLWAPSKDGYLKPRVRIEPVNIGGARIEYATAFNGAFVKENKIGVGAVVRMIRSGDVIPYIMTVVTPASTTKMPDVPYIWNDTQIDVLLEDASKDPIVLLKNITGFFTGIGVVGLSSGNVKRIMDAGFNSIHKILSMTISNFLEVDGFKEKLASKVHSSIHSQLEKVPLAKLMSATNLFGRGMGERRIQSVLDSFPNILISDIPHIEKVKQVASIDGFASKTAIAFVDHIDEFLEFAKENNLMERIKNKSKSKTGSELKMNKKHPLYGKSVLMTGFRDKALEQRIKDVGGKIASAVSKNTNYVVVIDMDETTGKAEKARALGVTIILVEDFNKLLE